MSYRSDLPPPQINDRVPDDMQVPIDFDAKPMTAEQKLMLPDDILAVHQIASEMPALQSVHNLAVSALKSSRNKKGIPHPGPRPHPEAGGMDHADYDAALYEYKQQDDTSHNEGNEPNMRGNAEDAIDRLLESKGMVQEGDEDEIRFYAGKAKALLRAELLEKAQRQEGIEGKVFEGADHVARLADGLLVAASSNWTDAKEKVGPNGWELQGFHGGIKSSRVFMTEARKGAVPSAYSYAEKLVLYKDDEGVLSVHYSKIPDNARVVWDEDDEWRKISGLEDVQFKVNADGLVTAFSHKNVSVSQQHLVGSQFTQFFDSGSKGKTLPFDESTIAMISDKLQLASQDMQSITHKEDTLAEV